MNLPNLPRRLLVAAAALLVIGLGLSGWYLWSKRDRDPAPPAVRLDGTDERVAKAVQMAQDRVRKAPRDAKAWGLLGKVLLANSYPNEALECFRTAERLDREEPRWPYLQAIVLLNRQDVDGALPLLRWAADRADRHDRGQPVPRLMLAEVLLDQRGQADEAGQLLRQVGERDPDNPRVLFDLGRLAFARGDLGAAADHLARVADHPLTRRKAAALLSRIALQRDDPRAAADHNRRAQELPDDLNWDDPYQREYAELAVGKQTKLERAQAAEASGNVMDATAIIDDVMSGGPGASKPLASFAAAVNLSTRGRYPEAEQMLLEVLRSDPGMIQAHYMLGYVRYLHGEMLLARSGNREQALAQFRGAAEATREAIRRKPNHAFAHMFLGRSLLQLGKRTEAIAALRIAAKCRPEDPGPHLHLGEALAEDGRPDEARRELEEAVRCARPDNPFPAQRLKEFQKRSGHQPK